MPYLTATPSMAPLVMRPANASEAASDHNSAPSATNAYGDKIIPLDDTDMRDDEDLLRDLEARQQDEECARKLTAKNRRKRYLEMHPEYFLDASLELADPLLYNRLIRRFQSTAEREAEGQRRGLSGRMATVMCRDEAQKDALSQPDPDSLFTYSRGSKGDIIEEDKDDISMSKEEGLAWWVDEMTQRFLRGADDDFEYDKLCDGNANYDDPEQERDLQDRWFESMESDFDSDGEGKEKVLTGETGIQDY